MVCSIEGCELQATARGWCNTHYQRWYRLGDPQSQLLRIIAPEICTIDGCEKIESTRGWCSMHYSRWLRHGDPLFVERLRTHTSGGPCAVVDCEFLSYIRGFCRRHYWKQHSSEPTRRAQKRGAFVEYVDRALSFLKYNGICYLCDEKIVDEVWHLDHIVPLSRGGEHSYANTAPTHIRCNQRKYNKLLSEMSS